MKNWDTVDADVVKLMNKHYTPGRGGKRIKYIVRHHNAGILTVDQIWQVWQTRQASAHYQVEISGRIGQLVWDRDTAWHAADTTRNQESIGIEHANSADGRHVLPITDATIDNGAHLAAALCHVHKLGRPVFGKNIRDHKETGQTACPYHLAGPSGKYHKRWMDRAVYWYDKMAGKATTPTTPKGDSMTPAQEKKIDQMAAAVAKLQSDVTDIRLQQGSGKNYSGFEQTGHRTLLDSVAAIGAKLGVVGMKDVK